jgi:Nucleotidyltransferase domain
VVLYGSSVRGTRRDDSDIDLLAIGSEDSVLVRAWWTTDRMRALAGTWTTYGLGCIEEGIVEGLGVAATSPTQIARLGPVVGSLERFALLEGRIVFDVDDDSIVWPDHAPASACLLPSKGGTAADQHAVVRGWLGRARESLNDADRPMIGGAKPANLAARCCAAFSATHAALMAVFAAHQEDLLWTRDLSALAAQLPPTWSGSRDFGDLSELQRWEGWDSPENPEASEPYTADLVQQARRVFDAVQHGLLAHDVRGPETR